MQHMQVVCESCSTFIFKTQLRPGIDMNYSNKTYKYNYSKRTHFFIIEGIQLKHVKVAFYKAGHIR